MIKERAVNKIADIYTLLFMVGFPLVITDKYYNIQKTKLYFYIFTTLAFVVAAAAALVIEHVRRPVSSEGSGIDDKKSLPAGKKAGIFGSLRTFVTGLGLGTAEIFALSFFVIIVISTIFSEWTYEAFWGNMGRYNGLYTWIFYIAGYMLISQFARPREWYCVVFAVVGLIVCTWGVMDFFYHSPFGWQVENGSDYKAFDFSSTLGNINLLTAYEGMILLAAGAFFLGEDRSDRVHVIQNAIYALTSVSAFMGLICGMSDNAIISVAAALCFLPFYAFRSRKSILKYLGLVVMWFGSMVFTGLLIGSGVRTVSRPHWGELLCFCADHTDAAVILTAAAAILFALFSAIFFISGGRPDEGILASRLRLVWAMLGVLAACALIYVFYDANHGGVSELYQRYSTIFIFNDEWGTHRGFNWSLALGYFSEFPLFKKIFGSGPETYFVYTLSQDYYTMMGTFNETYDSPHNEWIQYLLTTGIAGFAMYYGWVVASIVNGFRKHAGALTLLAKAAAFSLLVYTLVSFVNISAPIINAPVILSLALVQASCRTDGLEEAC